MTLVARKRINGHLMKTLFVKFSFFLVTKVKIDKHNTISNLCKMMTITAPRLMKRQTSKVVKRSKAIKLIFQRDFRNPKLIWT